MALTEQRVRRVQLLLVAGVGAQKFEDLPDVEPAPDHPRAPW
jgi:hypothetical protein